MRPHTLVADERMGGVKKSAGLVCFVLKHRLHNTPQARAVAFAVMLVPD